ncbi:hypothetical protein RBB50_001628 [Rhinocladiella similis]
MKDWKFVLVGCSCASFAYPIPEHQAHRSSLAPQGRADPSAPVLRLNHTKCSQNAVQEEFCNANVLPPRNAAFAIETSISDHATKSSLFLYSLCESRWQFSPDTLISIVFGIIGVVETISKAVRARPIAAVN